MRTRAFVLLSILVLVSCGGGSDSPLAGGKSTYADVCSVCHGASGDGGVGRSDLVEHRRGAVAVQPLGDPHLALPASGVDRPLEGVVGPSGRRGEGEIRLRAARGEEPPDRRGPASAPGRQRSVRVGLERGIPVRLAVTEDEQRGHVNQRKRPIATGQTVTTTLPTFWPVSTYSCASTI